MKIVGFESSEGLHLGVVEGDQVIDLQAVDARLPANLKLLGGIKGVGAEKATRYGAAILTQIRDYQQKLSGTKDQASLF